MSQVACHDTTPSKHFLRSNLVGDPLIRINFLLTPCGSLKENATISCSMHCQCCRLLQSSDTVLHRLLYLLEGAHFDLAHAFARDFEFGGQILKRDRIVGEAPRLEDAPLAIVEHVERAD